MGQILKVGFFFVIACNMCCGRRELCKKRATMFAVGVCENKYKDSCCPPAGTARMGGCSRGADSFACHRGLYKSPDNAVLPCPDGYFCPESKTCMLPCPVGSYCKKSEPDPVLNNTATMPVCRRDNVTVRPVHLGSHWLCPGESKLNVCERGYFCSTVKTKQRCPKGFFCRDAVQKPEKCSLSFSCKQESNSNSGTEICIIIGITIVIVLLLAYWVFVHKEYIVKSFKAKTKRLNGAVADVSKMLEITLGIRAFPPVILNIEAKTDQVKLQFKGLVLKQQDKHILNGVEGEFESGSLNAILGPSGGGKSSLLKVLSGKAPGKLSKGDILVNGTKVKDIQVLGKISGYVPQDDVMHMNLTPREILSYQGLLRLQGLRTNKQVQQKVSEVLEMLHLKQVEHSVICDHNGNGLSGGERKRVNIAMELIAEPLLLFLDEPSSGLDSATTLLVMEILKALAAKGLTIVCVLHQPRYEVFMMAQSVMFLSKDGRTIIQGTQSRVTDFFKKLGIVTPVNANPADYFMDFVTEVPFRRMKAKLSRTISLKPFEIQGNRQADVKEAGIEWIPKARERSAFFPQFLAILSRQFLLQQRNARVLILNYLLSIIAGLFHALMYREVEFIQVSIMAAITSLVMGVTSMLIAVRQFADNRPQLQREVHAGLRVSSYYLAVEVSYLPHILLLPLAYLSLNYPIVFPRASFIEYYYVGVIIYFSTSGFSYWTSLVMQPKNAQMAVVVYGLVSCLLSGTMKSICEMHELPLVGSFLCNLSYSRWTVEYIFYLEQKTITPVLRPVADYFSFKNNYQLDNSFVCLTVMISLGLANRVLAFLALKFIVCRK